MPAITSVIELKNAIQRLESEQENCRQLLKEQFYRTSQSFRPVNILRNTLKSIPGSPYFVDTILIAAIGLAINYFAKKGGIGSTSQIIKKFIASVLKLGVTKVIIQESDSIRSFVGIIFQHLFHKKEMNPQKS